jgi:hypothetical protein
MEKREIDLVTEVVLEIARHSAHDLLNTHPEELAKFISQEKTIKGIHDKTKVLLTAAIMFVMKTLEMDPETFSPQEVDDGLKGFLVEFMRKRS